jgi:hypothetical protein
MCVCQTKHTWQLQYMRHTYICGSNSPFTRATNLDAEEWKVVVDIIINHTRSQVQSVDKGACVRLSILGIKVNTVSFLHSDKAKRRNYAFWAGWTSEEPCPNF